MPVVEELWNNATSPYKNWHKKIKWFSILFKPNTCQKNRKEKNTCQKDRLIYQASKPPCSFRYNPTLSLLLSFITLGQQRFNCYFMLR